MGRKNKKKSQKGGPTSTAKPAKGTARPADKAAHGVAERRSVSPTKQRIGRIAAIALGVVFILAGTLKVGDPWSFLGSLPAYGVPSFIRLPVTVAMPTIEVILGIMLIAGWRLRESSLAAAGFLAVFGVFIAYGWSMGTLQDCGCFGPMLKRTPPEALAQDAVMFGMAVLGMLWAPAAGKLSFTRFQLGTLATVGVASVALIGGTLMADPGTLEDRIAAAEPQVGKQAPSLEELNLRNRDVFLYLFHPDCPHCVENGPQMARIAADAELPEVIGITHSVDPGEVNYYLQHAGADITAYEFSLPSFVQITGDGAVPQLVYLQQGRVARVWKGNLPGTLELKRAVGATSSP
jgi:uncharacterized membrane protein YphA (DoxX/SURF4 family)